MTSRQTRLTSDTSLDFQPSWSPDGTRIAFVSLRGGRGADRGSRIHVMNADGSGVRLLTSGVGTDVEPAWSPDGTKIAVTRQWIGDAGDIFVMNADGGGVRLLTTTISDASPAWQGLG